MMGEKALNKLATYENLEEHELLVRLPCKPGATVYIIVGKSISVQKIVSIRISNIGIEFTTSKRTFHIKDFYKTVFLTHAEAEDYMRGDCRYGKR